MKAASRARAQNLLLFAVTWTVALTVGILATDLYFWLDRDPDAGWHDINTQFDPELGWRTIPSRHSEAWGGITSNSLGFRSPEPLPNKPVIAVAGDSVAFGFGVSDEQTLSHNLFMRVGPAGFQVQNLAVSGYGLGQQYLWLRKQLDTLDDLRWLVLVIYTGNDLQDTSSNARWGKSKPLFVFEDEALTPPHTPISKYSVQNLLSLSYVATRLGGLPAARALLDSAAGTVVLPNSEAKRVAAALIEKIETLAKRRGARFVAVLTPWLGDFNRKTSDLAWFQRLLRTRDIPTVDLYAATTENGWKLEDMYLDATHLTGLGNQRLADIIFEQVLSGVGAR